jgi:malonyl-ACP decarboxylase
VTVPPVITGLGVVCSLGHDVESFAAGLRAGRSAVSEQPQDTDGPRYAARIAGFTLDAAMAALRHLPEEIRRTAIRVSARSPGSVRVGLAAAAQAWESAQLHGRAVAAERVGLVISGHDLTGAYAHDVHISYAANPAHVPPRFALHMFATDQVAMLSRVLGILGEGITVSAASAGGNAAIIAGARLLAGGEADACLVLGALAEPSSVELRALCNLGALAWTTPSVPFDGSRAGFVLGEAAACLVLETAESARGRGAAVRARLTGYAHRLDGNSLANPTETGEAAVMAAALRRAGLAAGDVGYINAHGTGSVLGDRTEIAAIRRVFGEHVPGPWVNSTKSLVGHCLGAAGVVEAVATVIQIAEGYVHANADLIEPMAPACRFVGARAEPARVDVALSNGFAFGGVNTCLVLARER